MTRSPLFYVGDKYKLMEQLSELFPKNIDTYVEPFLGGGSSQMNTNANKYILNDIDKSIYGIHKMLLSYCNKKEEFFESIFSIIDKYGLSCSYRNDIVPKKLKEEYKKTYYAKFNKEGYDRLKNDYNKEGKNDFLKLYVLLIYGFNHMVRFNTKGEFNLPVGNVDFNKNVYNALNDYFDIEANRKIDLMNVDFEDFIKGLKLTKSDFVYLDPPYNISGSEYNKLWNDDDDKRLYKLLDELNAKGIRFGITNLLVHKDKRNKLFEDFSKKYNSKIIDSNYISYNDNTTKPASVEMYVYNYDVNSDTIVKQEKVNKRPKNNVVHRPRKYKQIAIEVAVRNADRLGPLLRLFNRYEGIMLDDEGCLEVYTELYRSGFLDVETTAKTREEFREIAKKDSHNADGGFPKGYQASLYRYFRTLEELGLIYAQYNQKLEISEVAKAYISNLITLSEVFALQTMRSWRKNPIRRVLNDFNYYKFVIESIKKLSEIGNGMTYNQFLLSLFSDNGDVSDFIEDARKNSFGIDKDALYDYICQKYSQSDKNHDKVNKQTSAFNDYGNSVFRLLYLTGFINVEHKGIMRITINKRMEPLYNALSKFDFSLTEDEKENESDFYDKLSTFDSELYEAIINNRPKEDYSTKDYNAKLKNIVEEYNIDKPYLESYMQKLISTKSKDSSDFWYVSSPEKLEFLLTLYVYVCYGDEYEYHPNYKCSDNGIPYGHAPGGIGDIEIYNSTTYWLIEATLIRSKDQQLNAETVNLFRHLSKLEYQKKYLTLVAPYVHQDTILINKVASIVTGIEQKCKIYSSSQTVNDFIRTTSNKTNFSVMEGLDSELINSLIEYCNMTLK